MSNVSFPGIKPTAIKAAVVPEWKVNQNFGGKPLVVGDRRPLRYYVLCDKTTEKYVRFVTVTIDHVGGNKEMVTDENKSKSAMVTIGKQMGFDGTTAVAVGDYVFPRVFQARATRDSGMQKLPPTAKKWSRSWVPPAPKSSTASADTSPAETDTPRPELPIRRLSAG